MARELVIEAGRAERQYWKDLWRYRELFFILTWRDVAVQYKQTAVGILWAVLRPLLTMAAFTFVFAKVAKLPSEGQAPYPLMVFVAMLPLAVVCYRHFGHCKQPSCKQQSCFQGIFSPHYCTGCHHRRGSGGFCTFFLGNPAKAKAKAKLGWTPRTTFEDMVAEMAREGLVLSMRDAVCKVAGFQVITSCES